MMQDRVLKERAESLADNLFSLEEPWRGRFLTFVAKQSTRWVWNGRLPTRDEVAAWLGDEGMFEVVTSLLDTWQGCALDKPLPVH
jgi:lysyl-tRNA synthetase class II